MDFATIFFILVGALSVAAAVGVVSAKVVVHSALFLLVHFVTLAVLYITLDAQFLGAAQVIIYAGGIVILILFVIMLIGSGESGAAPRQPWLPLTGLALGLVMLGTLGYGLMQTAFGAPVIPGNEGGIPEAIGMEMFTRYILPVEMVAILLLVALLGALLLAKNPPVGEE